MSRPSAGHDGPNTGSFEASGKTTLKDDGNIPTQRVKDYRETGSIPGLVGTTLDGRFRVLRRIAGGATGQVYEALQAPFDRRVAVKVLDIDASADPTFRARFQREASLAARVAHPNIVTIYDYGETPDGQMYMVMELLRGRSLARVLREEGRLHPSHALDIALQMTRALRRAHQHGIVHRDLKPANVVLESSDDASDLVKVLDFGLVKLLEPGRGSDLEGVGERLTAVGAMLGTPGYMSPEQAMGEDVDARTDVYACGVILYELLSGAKPFAGPTVQDVLSKQIMQPVPPIYGLDTSAEAAEATERLIRDCLHPNRAHRPASAEVLLARLKEVWRMESDTAYGTEASFVGPRLPTADISSPSQSLSLEGVLN
ncbi:MAG: serine/threonine-protein kinase, partial [Myxococcota bacterium]